jgi:hypothetical protein
MLLRTVLRLMLLLLRIRLLLRRMRMLHQRVRDHSLGVLYIHPGPKKMLWTTLLVLTQTVSFPVEIIKPVESTPSHF